jgi:hypothetical protein
MGESSLFRTWSKGLIVSRISFSMIYHLLSLTKIQFLERYRYTKNIMQKVSVCETQDNKIFRGSRVESKISSFFSFTNRYGLRYTFNKINRA